MDDLAMAAEDMELRCVLAVVRHGDRTPKQKMKMVVNQARCVSGSNCIRLIRQSVAGPALFWLCKCELQLAMWDWSDPDLNHDPRHFSSVTWLADLLGRCSSLQTGCT